MQRLWRNQKALTPVLSNVLMIVIAVAGMSLATTATYVITANLKQTMGERFIVEDVWFRSGTISVYLRNTGKTAIDFAGVYINYAAQSFVPFHLEPLEHGWMNLTYTWKSNTAYYVNIVSSRGTQVADYYKSP